MSNKKIVNPDRCPLYIECGTTARSLIATGIQRVVRNVTQEAYLESNKFGFECIAIGYQNGAFYKINPSSAIGNEQALDAGLNLAAKDFTIIRLIDGLLGFFKRFGVYIRIRSKLKSVLLKYKAKKSVRDESGVELQPLSAKGEPAVLLLIDSTWDTSIWPSVDRFRGQGGKVCAVLYDLIPFTHPETVEEHTRQAHTKYWLGVHEHVDIVMCISQTVRQEYLAWLNKNGGNKKLPQDKVGYFYLGADLQKNDHFLQLLTEDTPYFMMIGSLEPRKNHATVLDAFELLWSKNIHVRLVIVGGFGWKSEALLERIQGHPELGCKLFLIRDASDRDLTALYKAASAVIIASLAEGFGLPIVEAKQHGAGIICSDIPVFHEVVGVDEALYFPPMEPDALAARVIDFLSSKKSNGINLLADSRGWISWRESCEQLIDGMLKRLRD